MTRDEILIAMMKAGAAKYDLMPTTYAGVVAVFERFAALVAAAEREACAAIAETPVTGEQDDITMEAKDRVAVAIRARGQK